MGIAARPYAALQHEGHFVDVIEAAVLDCGNVSDFRAWKLQMEARIACGVRTTPKGGKMNSLARLVVGAALLVMVPVVQAAPSEQRFPWPRGALAAVSLSYDDALDSQLDNALPALDHARLKASFYLQLSNPSVRRRMHGWRAAARHGHELGNHTLFHQCSSALPERAWVTPHRDLLTTSVAQVKDQALLANTMLLAIDGKRERTFTAPCGDLQAGGESYLPSIAGEFVAIKAGAADGPVASMWTLDPYAVPVVAPVGLGGRELIEMVKAAGASGTMLNLTFHGVGGDYLATSAEAHRELLAFLAANRKLYWTDTFLNVMKHVKTQQVRRQRR
jgi:peptidoglycan/xylan/chitin deacetylase (PgdA/CDA1 family)